FDIGEAEEITAAFEQAGLVGAVGYVERYNPALQEMRRRIADGQLGEIYQIATRRQGGFPARIADVGVVKDLATHDLDLTAWVAQSQFARVAAGSTRRSGRDDEDMVSVTGTLLDGTITSHLVNWLSPFKERVTVVTGEKGALVADTLNADLTFHTNANAATNLWESMASFRGVSEGDAVRYALQRREPLATEHEGCRDAVLGSGATIATMREGLHTVRAVAGVDEAARTETTGQLQREAGDGTSGRRCPAAMRHDAEALSPSPYTGPATRLDRRDPRACQTRYDRRRPGSRCR